MQYSYSSDLIDWTPRQLLFEAPLAHHLRAGGNHYLYASLLDPESDSRNFETSGRTAYIYMTRYNDTGNPLDRDLVRIPAEFFDTAEQADRARVTFRP